MQRGRRGKGAGAGDEVMIYFFCFFFMVGIILGEGGLEMIENGSRALFYRFYEFENHFLSPKF